MQKAYIRPALIVQAVEIETFIAMSGSGPQPAGDDDYPTFDSGSPVKENIWDDTVFSGE
jgi:hypothetical protein